MTPPPPSPARPPAEPGRVVLAAITGAHGIGGEVKLKLFAQDLAAFRSFNEGALTLASLRGDIARFVEIGDRAAAEALRGTALSVPRSALPPLGEGEYYHADLLGLSVRTPDGAQVGQVVAVNNFGAGDVIEIERSGGALFMVPVSPAAVLGWGDDHLVLDPAWLA